jgi:hypothetical protein
MRAYRRRQRSKKLPVILGSGQNPVCARQSANLYDVDRKVHCFSYRVCLNFAYQERWQSFACSSCTAYKDGKDVILINAGNQWEGA